jgi:hypothetical protein
MKNKGSGPLAALVPCLAMLACLLACESWAQEIETLKRGVVKVVTRSNGQIRSQGTGFIVRRESNALYVVTASHVAEGADEIGVEVFSARRLFPARILGMEGGDPQGLAVLVVEGETPADVGVLIMNREATVQAGEPVTMIGFPRNVGVPWAVTKGALVGRRGRAIVFSGAVDEGNSGGPLIKDNQVVGVVTSAQGPYAYASPSLIAQYALESWGVRFGVTLRSKPATLYPDDIVRMIREKGFNLPGVVQAEGYRTGRTPALIQGIGGMFGPWRNGYEAKTIGSDRIVIDHSTNLMWQQSGSVSLGEGDMSIEAKSEMYLSQKNQQRYAGFPDWRLPTIEELASLMEPRGSIDGSFIDSMFDTRVIYCLSADTVLIAEHDYIARNFVGFIFSNGRMGLIEKRSRGGDSFGIRAVRSMKADELTAGTIPSPK